MCVVECIVVGVCVWEDSKEDGDDVTVQDVGDDD